MAAREVSISDVSGTEGDELTDDESEVCWLQLSAWHWMAYASLQQARFPFAGPANSWLIAPTTTGE